MLRKLPVTAAPDAALLVHDEGGAAGRALVEGKDGLHGE